MLLFLVRGISLSALSNLIRNQRLLKNLSNRKLAEYAGISSTEMMKIEKGIRENPPGKTLKLIAEALEIDQIEMMTCAGYIDANYLSNLFKLRGLEKLDPCQIDCIQQYINFLNYCSTIEKNHI
jgi:transcriptional regulator with XRE-family HTH domain